MTPNLKGLLLVLLSSFFFGSYGVWSRLIGDSFGDVFQGYVRALFIVLISIPIGLKTQSFKKIRKNDLGWWSVILACSAFTVAPIFYAFNHMDIGLAILLFYSSMLITMYAIGYFFLKEELSLVKIISLLLGLAGLFLTLNLSLTQFGWLPALMALFNGVASGGEVSFTKKVSDHYSSLQISTYVWGIILITNSIVSLALGEDQVMFSFTLPWLYMIGYSLSALLAFYFVIEGFKYVEASIGGLAGLMEIVFGIVLGIILFQEPFSLPLLVGMLLIMGAAATPHLESLLKSSQREHL